MRESLDAENTLEEVRQLLKGMDMDQLLLVLSNALFEQYEELRKKDLLYRQIDKSPLTNLESFSELEEVYGFAKDSYVYRVLNSAHEILSVASSIARIEWEKQQAILSKSGLL